MTFPFNPHQGLILVGAEVTGPAGTATVRLALDSGATATLINAGILVAIGYDPALAAARVQVTTGSSMEYVPRVVVSRLGALGRERLGFPVLAHTLPPSAGVDGLLGLDFLRGQVLTVDFRAGQIDLA
jgi:gag-polyprotein putative aspartyl protease